MSRRRAAPADGSEPPSGAAPAPSDAPATAGPAEGHGPTSLLADPATAGERDAATTAVGEPGAGTTALAAPDAAEAARDRDLPAGLDPAELEARPQTSARRAQLRRRLRFLRASRELLLRDLGGFTYELHRTLGTGTEAHARLRDRKVARLAALDDERFELEARLSDPGRDVIVREPGIGGLCAECGELVGSDFRFCAHCGAPQGPKARRARAAGEGAATTPEPVADDAAGASQADGGPTAAPDGEATTAAEDEPRSTGATEAGTRTAAAADREATGAQSAAEDADPAADRATASPERREPPGAPAPDEAPTRVQAPEPVPERS